VRIEPVTARHREALAAFAAGISDRDRRFADRSLLSQVAVASWTQAVPERRLVAVEDDGKVSGLATVSRGHGWSEHTAELRVIVATGQRGRGVGRALADAAVGLARDLGISKVTVETMATNEGGQAMFRALGFDAEAVLRGHVIDADGERQDVVILSRWLDA
jgi:ribosomal protein S18 acetylase RimI-like enzyme